jgi:hypothetical protein
MLKQSALLLAASLVAACASHLSPQANSASSGDSTGPSQEQGGKGDGSWADSQREAFMRGCSAKVKMPEYCECAFGQFREVFKDNDGQDPPASDPRFKALEERTRATCASKLPEDVVKASFLSSCVEDEKRKTSYCECAWPALRKNLAVPDFSTDFQGPRFDEARKAMVATCKGKYPADLAKADFIKGCLKTDASRAKCDCAWKKLRAKFSTEEIVAGLVDPAAAGVSACK